MGLEEGHYKLHAPDAVIALIGGMRGRVRFGSEADLALASADVR
jgi:hypothetical protein